MGKAWLFKETKANAWQGTNPHKKETHYMDTRQDIPTPDNFHPDNFHPTNRAQRRADKKASRGRTTPASTHSSSPNTSAAAKAMLPIKGEEA